MSWFRYELANDVFRRQIPRIVNSLERIAIALESANSQCTGDWCEGSFRRMYMIMARNLLIESRMHDKDRCVEEAIDALSKGLDLE